jgi:hypothetical protein
MMPRALPFLAVLTLSPSSYAQPPGPPRTPPKEAFEACASSHEGDACTVKLPDRELDGVCTTFRDAGLACRPNRPPPPPDGQPKEPS